MESKHFFPTKSNWCITDKSSWNALSSAEFVRLGDSLLDILGIIDLFLLFSSVGCRKPVDLRVVDDEHCLRWDKNWSIINKIFQIHKLTDWENLSNESSIPSISFVDIASSSFFDSDIFSFYMLSERNQIILWMILEILYQRNMTLKINSAAFLSVLR